MSKADTLRTQTLDQVVQNSMNRAQVEYILLVQDLHENLKSVQEGLKSIADRRRKEKKDREEKESNLDPTEKNKMVQSPNATDQYSEEEKSLKSRERNLLEKIQKILLRQEQQLQVDREYQMTIRKSMASQSGDIGDMTGKGYVDLDRKGERKLYTNFLPQTSEHRFDTIDTLPRIASKYKKNDRGFSLQKMSTRDPNFMVKESFGGMLSSEQKGFKPVIKG